MKKEERVKELVETICFVLGNGFGPVDILKANYPDVSESMWNDICSHLIVKGCLYEELNKRHTLRFWKE